MEGLIDVLERIIGESLWDDPGMLKRWPMVCWAAYRATERMWPGIVRQRPTCLRACMAAEIEFFERYCKDRVLNTTVLWDGQCVLVLYPPMIVTMRAHVVEHRRVSKITGTYGLVITCGSSHVRFVVADKCKPVLVYGVDTAFARAIEKVFPELFA